MTSIKMVVGRYYELKRLAADCTVYIHISGEGEDHCYHLETIIFYYPKNDNYLVAYGIDSTFTTAIWELVGEINKNDFDKLLVREML